MEGGGQKPGISVGRTSGAWTQLIITSSVSVTSTVLSTNPYHLAPAKVFPAERRLWQPA